MFTDTSLREKVICWRRWLHQHPEEGWTEFGTTALVAENLQHMGYSPLVGQEILDPDHRLGLPGPEILQQARQRAFADGAHAHWLERMGMATGVVADLHPGEPVHLVLRFDIDALPLTESRATEHFPARQGFRSAHEGLCHACGHDGHTALGLAVAALLQREARHLKNIRFIFQPAEEGVRGAASLTHQVAGAQYLICLHLGLNLPRSGALITGITGFLATSKFDATFTGASGHAGLNESTELNALQAGAEAVLALRALPGKLGLADKGRINVGQFHAGTARNIVPATAQLCCESRAVDQDSEKTLMAAARHCLEIVAAQSGLGLDFTIQGHAACAHSDAPLAELAAHVARSLPPDEEGRPQFDPEDIATCGQVSVSEDAATLMQTVQQGGGQAIYALLGAHLAGGHHCADFDFDENVLWPSVLWLAELSHNLCASPSA